MILVYVFLYERIEACLELQAIVSLYEGCLEGELRGRDFDGLDGKAPVK